MEEESIHYWASRIEALASEASGGSFNLDRRSLELGPYTDDSCCAFLCAYALDRYLESNLKHCGEWPTGPELRERYFRRLLIHWGVPPGFLPDRTAQMDFDVVDSPQSTVVSSYLSGTTETSGRDFGQLDMALNDTGSPLRTEEKARLIQMIMECNPLSESELSMPQPARASHSLKELFAEIDEIKVLFQSHGYQHRRLLVETAKEFEVQLAIETMEQKKKRAASNAQFSSRAKQARSKQKSLESNEKAGKGVKEDNLQRKPKEPVQQGQHNPDSPRTAISMVIWKATGLRTRKPLRTRYWKYVEEGRILQKIEKILGGDILRCLPGAVVRPDETVVKFQNARKCFNVLRQNIFPIQYNALNSDNIAFFGKSFKILRPELGPFE
ncbi:hypothetical protein CKAH01_17167 [Colletotrichum kahawae]|uniref:Uncharacterized protein n=1 Tax=Colletotrichum kahawae TaxID=34407 RepID=A0AAD9YD49_COLKA|nr:hypothetical protein CKAH01_17167 [Colletotrichum kahawae]